MMRYSNNHSHKQLAGFTLIEIMVALAISALLLGGIVQVFFTLKQTNKVSTALSRIQESGQVAYDIMSYDARMAGFVGCADPSLKMSVVVVASNTPIYGGSYLSSSVWGTDVTATGWGTATGLDMGTTTAINGSGARNARLNSDVVRFQHLTSANMPLSANMTSKASNVTIGSNVLGLTTGNLAVVSNCVEGNLFRISSFSTSPVALAHSTSNNSSSDLTRTFTTDAGVYGFVSNTYFVGDTGRKNSRGDTIYGLFMRDVNNNVNELVEGVDYMRILYGQKFSTNNVRYVDASDSHLNMDEVASVKIALLLVSDEPVLDSDDTHRYILLDTPIANTGTTITYPNDRRMRRVFNMTIQLRNRGL